MSTQFDIDELKSLCKYRGISFTQDVRDIVRQLPLEYARKYGELIAHSVTNQVRASGTSDSDYAVEFYRQLSVAPYEAMVTALCKALSK